jgi:hypothetical protein
MCPLDTKDHFNYSIYCTDPFSKYRTRLGQKLTLQYLVYVRPLFRVQRQARMWRKKNRHRIRQYICYVERKNTQAACDPQRLSGPLSLASTPLSAIGLISLIALVHRVTAASSFVSVGHDLTENDRVEIHLSARGYR